MPALHGASGGRVGERYTHLWCRGTNSVGVRRAWEGLRRALEEASPAQETRAFLSQHPSFHLYFPGCHLHREPGPPQPMGSTAVRQVQGRLRCLSSQENRHPETFQSGECTLGNCDQTIKRSERSKGGKLRPSVSNWADTVSPRAVWEMGSSSGQHHQNPHGHCRNQEPGAARQGDCRTRVHAHDTEGCQGAGRHGRCSAPGTSCPEQEAWSSTQLSRSRQKRHQSPFQV